LRIVRRLHTALLATALVGASVALLVVLDDIPSAGAAAVIDVTVDTDGGAGSLRAAFATASTDGQDTEIVLQAGHTYDLTDCTAGALAHGEAHNLTITGHGSTIRQTCSGWRVIDNIGSSGLLTVDGVTVTGGNVSVITGGGGIGATSGGLVIRNSTLTGNSAGTGGGVFVTGQGSLTVVNSTVTGNTGTDSTGFGGLEAQGNITLVYATVAANTAGGSGEPANVGSGGSLTSFGSVIANPLGTSANNCAITGAKNSQGYNFSDDSSCFFNTATDRQDAGDPALAPMSASGLPGSVCIDFGCTYARGPLPGSPLLDAIPIGSCQADGAAGITRDEIGRVRPSGTGCDIGAIEIPVAPAPPPVVIPPSFTG
jgi:hypothetical protein